jgi:hypothetical protein
MFRELEGESVLLNIETETYFGLDDVGTRMWTRLIASETIQQAFDALLDEYDVAPETLKTDLTDLLQQLVEKGLLEVGHAPPA